MTDKPISNALGDGVVATTPGLSTPVSVDDLRAFSIVVADLADAGVMGEAWR